MILTPKNWKSFQHYKDRAPAWIKLHRGLLDDFDFCCLPVASRALAPFLWLLASEYEDGQIKGSLDALAFRLRMTKGELADALVPLVEKGFFDANEPLAERKQAAIPEKEEEREREEEKRKRKIDARAVALAEPAKRSNSTRGQRLREDWQPTPPDLAIAETLLGEHRARGEIEKFRDYWKAQPGQRGVKLDWNATFRVWVRNAKPTSGRGPPREENAYRQSQQETKELLHELENFATGCSNGRQADLGLLPGNSGLGQADIHLGADRDAGALSARSRRHSGEPGAGHTIEAEVLEPRRNSQTA